MSDEARKALEEIAIACTANMDRDLDHRRALDFVRQIANDALDALAALRVPLVEPVAWRWHWRFGDESDIWAYAESKKNTDDHIIAEPLYAAPSPLVGPVKQMTRPPPTNSPYSTERLAQQLMDSYEVCGDQVFYQASTRLTAFLETRATEPATPSPLVGREALIEECAKEAEQWVYGYDAADAIRALPAQAGASPEREVLDWIETWISNPVGAYSVSALEGLFGMTRDKIAALPRPECCQHRRTTDGPRVDVRWGTAPTEVCDACGMWRTTHHTPGIWQDATQPSDRANAEGE